jgi:hypothetical protein
MGKVEVDAVSDEEEALASRGGAVLSWPWQDSDEVLLAHPALRVSGERFMEQRAAAHCGYPDVIA